MSPAGAAARPTVAFAGTPAFARTALDALLDAGYPVRLVLTQPDRPAGRGLRPQPSAVKAAALDHGLPLAQPRGLKPEGRWADDAAAARAALHDARPDVLVVAAYGLILPPWVLALPRFGALNIHASLLPRWRGAAPIQRAIEAGDRETGVTIMQMDEGLDTGAMRLVARTPIGADDTSATLHARLADLGAALVVDALERLVRGDLPSTPQPADGVTYAAKVDKAEAQVDWRDDAVAIERRLRAFDPTPGCHAIVDGRAVKLWRGRVVEGAERAAGTAPGERVEAGPGRLVVACGRGALEIVQLQLPGGRRIAAREFVAR